LAERPHPRRARYAWALADFAREPFFSFVLSLIFPPFFVGTLAADPIRGTALWGYGLATTSVLLVLSAPVAGALADATGTRRPWIAGSLALACGALGSLWLATAAPGRLLWVLASVIVAQLAIEWSRVYTDSLLPSVAPPEDVGALSGLAVGLGFAASLAYLALGYGVEAGDAPAARLLSVGSGLWLLVFMVPCLVFCPQPPRRAASAKQAIGAALAELRQAWSRLAAGGGLGRFLLARMLYWDGTMSLFSFLAIVASTYLKWDTRAMTIFGIGGLIAGAAAGVLGGRLESRLGARRTLVAGLVVLLAVTLTMAVALGLPHAAASPAESFGRPVDRLVLGLAIVACAALSLVMASSRSLLVQLADPTRLGEAFGLYVMVGRASSFLAPLLVAVVTTTSGDQRTGVFGVAAVLLTAGLLLLRTVPIRVMPGVSA